MTDPASTDPEPAEPVGSVGPPPVPAVTLGTREYVSVVNAAVFGVSPVPAIVPGTPEYDELLNRLLCGRP